MIFAPTPLNGCFEINVSPHTDNRGWFMRYYCKDSFLKIGHNKEWNQFNHSFTKNRGTIRGMHFQKHPYQEIKLIRCIQGSIFDVVIDLRKNSPTFLQWYGTDLSADNRKMIYIPAGFAHGFQTLTDNCELLYHHSEPYQPGYEGGISYNDACFNIEWPLPLSVISEKDTSYGIFESNFKGFEL